MNILKVILLACSFLVSAGVNAQQMVGLSSVPRKLNYLPDGESFVSINGKNRYTRPLYGSHDSWRLETSDFPVFAIYSKNVQRNIQFYLRKHSGGVVYLDSVDYCESRYIPGKRLYHLKDRNWNGGTIDINVIANYKSEEAVMKIEFKNIPSDILLYAYVREIRGKELQHNGDLGGEKPDVFEPDLKLPPIQHQQIYLQSGKVYLLLRNYQIVVPRDNEAVLAYEKAEEERHKLVSQFEIKTPDVFINNLGGVLMAAGEALWTGSVWRHTPMDWCIQHPGMRTAYVGDMLGWHERSRIHYSNYASSQVVDVKQKLFHPTQDPERGMSSSRMEWGLPIYSNGYICSVPRRRDDMRIYNNNESFIDGLISHIRWTGDKEMAKKMWPVIESHLKWEKSNFDPDFDGLYDSYATMNSSPGIYYNGGAVTYSSANNYKAFLFASELAKMLGKDGTAYRQEAELIKRAMHNRLWVSDCGHWAEYEDLMGHRMLHKSAGLWSIYQPIDCGLNTTFQSYQSTRYIDSEIPHIPVQSVGNTPMDAEVNRGDYADVSTTNWMPYAWSVNNVMTAESMNAALAYFQSGRANEGFKLFKSAIIDIMYLGRCPGNVGYISYLDQARGEFARDYGDAVATTARTVVEGLYGIAPDALKRCLYMKPQIPTDWLFASLKTPDITFDYRRDGSVERYSIMHNIMAVDTVEWRLPLKYSAVEIKVNGKVQKDCYVDPNSVQKPYMVFKVVLKPGKKCNVELRGQEGEELFANMLSLGLQGPGSFATLKNPSELHVDWLRCYDPEQIFGGSERLTRSSFKGEIEQNVPEGHHTFFIQAQQGYQNWWIPVDVEVRQKVTRMVKPEAFDEMNVATLEPVDMSGCFNANVTDIFKNKYLKPRPPYTTLQIPISGLGDWRHPDRKFDVDDRGLRAMSKNGLFVTDKGWKWLTPSSGKNILYTTLFDNYPDKGRVQLSGFAEHAYLMMAGSTNPMQSRIENGVVTVVYKDGSKQRMYLVNPTNWPSIDQAYFEDGKAFDRNAPTLYRLCLKTGYVTNHLARDINSTVLLVEGGAAVLLDMPLDMSKELDYLEVETLANDVVIGLMGVTLQR